MSRLTFLRELTDELYTGADVINRYLFAGSGGRGWIDNAREEIATFEVAKYA